MVNETTSLAAYVFTLADFCQDFLGAGIVVGIEINVKLVGVIFVLMKGLFGRET